MYLLPIACDFLAAYPDINLRLLLDDRVLRPLEDRIDVSIRIGVLPDSSMIATRIGSVRIVACASPSYLASQGHPEEPVDLCNHDCITIDDFAAPGSWRFAKDGNEFSVPIRSKLTVNTSEAAVEAAVMGAGIARVMSYKMQGAMRSGALQIVLTEFEREALPVNIVYPERKPMPLKVRAFLNWMTPRLKARLT
jgi:DNA-binding transcriptional LysR family regulator